MALARHPICGSSAVDDASVESGAGPHHDARDGVCVKLITERKLNSWLASGAPRTRAKQNLSD